MARPIRTRLQLVTLEDRTVPAPICSAQIDRAFWINANNAAVLKFVPDAIPIDQPAEVGAGVVSPSPPTNFSFSSSSQTWFDRAIGDATLRSLATTLATDGMLDRSDWMDLLTSAAHDGSISATDFDDLHDLFRPVRVGADIPRYVIPEFICSLTSAILDGDPANSQYQGTALGNLRPAAPVPKSRC